MKFRIATAKTAFNKNTFFTSRLGFNIRKMWLKCYIWNIAVFGAGIGTLQKIDQKYIESSEMCWRRMNKLLGRSCEKWRITAESLAGNEHPT